MVVYGVRISSGIHELLNKNDSMTFVEWPSLTTTFIVDGDYQPKKVVAIVH